MEILFEIFSAGEIMLCAIVHTTLSNAAECMGNS